MRNGRDRTVARGCTRISSAGKARGFCEIPHAFSRAHDSEPASAHRPSGLGKKPLRGYRMLEIGAILDSERKSADQDSQKERPEMKAKLGHGVSVAT